MSIGEAAERAGSPELQTETPPGGSSNSRSGSASFEIYYISLPKTRNRGLLFRKRRERCPTRLSVCARLSLLKPPVTA